MLSAMEQLSWQVDFHVAMAKQVQQDESSASAMVYT